MKVYEYLSEVLANNAIDFEEIAVISVVYVKYQNRFDHTTWRLVHKELRSTDDIPINPMHIEEWDDDVNCIYRVQGFNREELIMNIEVKLYNGATFYSLYCINPKRTPMILMD